MRARRAFEQTGVIVMHPFHMLLRALAQRAVRVTSEVAPKVISEGCVTFETKFMLLSKAVEKCLRVGRRHDEVINA